MGVWMKAIDGDTLWKISAEVGGAGVAVGPGVLVGVGTGVAVGTKVAFDVGIGVAGDVIVVSAPPQAEADRARTRTKLAINFFARGYFIMIILIFTLATIFRPHHCLTC